jgi:sarcosine oxidase subunit beta
MSTAFDAVVIGGGVVGTSVLYHLQAAGFGRTLLIERGDLADGASGKTAGLLQLNACRHRAEAELAYDSAAYYRGWSDIVGSGSSGFVETGYLRLEPPGREDALRERVARDVGLGWNSSVVGPAEVAAIAPDVRADDVAIGAYEPDAGYGDGRLVARSFAQRATELGASTWLGVEALDLIVSDDRLTGVSTSAGRVEAPIVVVAAGARTAGLLRAVGVEVPVVPVLTRTVTFAWPAGRGPRLMHVGDVRADCYLRPDGVDRVLIGVSHLARAPLPIDPAVWDDIAEDYIEACRLRLIDRIPSAADVRYVGGAGGPIGLSPDGLPIVDRHPELGGLYFAGADVGSTFKIAPALGRDLVRWITTGVCTAPVAELGLSRFDHVASENDLFAKHADYFRFGGTLPNRALAGGGSASVGGPAHT